MPILDRRVHLPVVIDETVITATLRQRLLDAMLLSGKAERTHHVYRQGPVDMKVNSGAGLQGQVLPFAPEVFFLLSSGVTKPMACIP